MELHEQTLSSENHAQIENSLRALPAPGESLCFFDIETTGLSPRVSSLYLIGAAYLSEGALCLKQWYADDYTSEAAILSSFAEFSLPFSVFVHYNGSTFDIPYLEKKYQDHGLALPFSGKGSLDIYRLARKKKDWFPAPDMKLATMEKLLGFRRHDRYTGKDCIELYTQFMQKKYFRDASADAMKQHLLLHNQDDLVGTILCSQLLHYTRPELHHPACSIRQNTLVIHDTLGNGGRYPFALEADWEGIHYSFAGSGLAVSIPLYHGTLHYYYKDYKNYYYLPDEDMAVHKSVGAYVDPGHREKATAANCYTKKTGTFLPLPKKFAPESAPLFKKERVGGPSFLFAGTEKEPALSEDLLRGLLSHIFN